LDPTLAPAAAVRRAKQVRTQAILADAGQVIHPATLAAPAVSSTCGAQQLRCAALGCAEVCYTVPHEAGNNA